MVFVPEVEGSKLGAYIPDAHLSSAAGHQDPGAAHLHPLARRNRRCVPYDGDEITLATYLDHGTRKPLSAFWSVTRSTSADSASIGGPLALDEAVGTSRVTAASRKSKQQMPIGRDNL